MSIEHMEWHRIPEEAVEIPEERIVEFLGREALEADMERFHAEAIAIEERTGEFNSPQRHRWYLGMRQEARNNRSARRHHPTRIENVYLPPDDAA